MAIERTFAMIKPDAVENRHAGEILTMIEQNGFRIVGLKMLQIESAEAEAFYVVHKQRPFYRGLVEFISSGAAIVMVLERDDAIARWRELMGATDPAKAANGTVRQRFAGNIERNAVHGSDALATAAEEIPFFFSTAELL